MGEGIVEEMIPKLLRAQTVVDHHQEAVKACGDCHHFGQRHCGVNPVEQGQREFRILPCVGGHTIFAHPARGLALDRRRHHIVHHNPPRNDQRSLPAKVERIAPRGAPQGIAALRRHADTADCICRYAIIGQMRQTRRLPPRAPTIGALFIAQISGSREPRVGIVAQGRWALFGHVSILLKRRRNNRYGYL
jgi:hypothetical protein